MTTANKTSFFVSRDKSDKGWATYQVYLEPLNTNVLFWLHTIKRIEIDHTANIIDIMRTPEMFQDIAGDLTVARPLDTSIRYMVYSDTRAPGQTELSQAGTTYPSVIKKLYLQHPDLDPRIESLAREIVKEISNPYDKVKAIETYLSKNYTYQLRSVHEGKDPLADFLFQNRQGHCEYFATAMTILTRNAGIPARVVVGFYGGEWNSYGNYLAIRQSDAHSWTEAYLPPYGWVTFDATPGSELEAMEEEGLLSDLRQLLDALQLKWYKWVIEYDLAQQLGFFHNIINDVLNIGEKEKKDYNWMDIFKKTKRAFSLKNAGWIIAVVLLSIVAFNILRYLLRSWKRSPTGRTVRLRRDGVTRLYSKMVRFLRSKGCPRKVIETPLEFVSRLRAEDRHGIQLVEEITWVYQRSIFGHEVITGEEVRLCRSKLKLLKSQFCSPHKTSSPSSYHSSCKTNIHFSKKY